MLFLLALTFLQSEYLSSLRSNDVRSLGVVPPQIDNLDVGMKLAVVGRCIGFGKQFLVHSTGILCFKCCKNSRF